MNLEQARHIAVEGPIGVGKTTLAGLLAARLGAQTLLERPADNPFLEKFYRDAARHALPTQLCFLFQRSGQLGALAQSAADARVVADFLLDKDPLFAALTLSEDELALYRQLYDQLRPPTPAPDLVIYLQAGPATLLERIRRRGIAMEAGISSAYLERLCESYRRFFYHYETAPVLIVDGTRFDPLRREQDLELLLGRIGQMRGRREFFNRGE